jgi:hypothetical protein
MPFCQGTKRYRGLCCKRFPFAPPGEIEGKNVKIKEQNVEIEGDNVEIEGQNVENRGSEVEIEG